MPMKPSVMRSLGAFDARVSSQGAGGDDGGHGQDGAALGRKLRREEGVMWVLRGLLVASLGEGGGVFIDDELTRLSDTFPEGEGQRAEHGLGS